MALFELLINGEKFDGSVLETTREKVVRIEGSTEDALVVLKRLPQAFAYANWYLFSDGYPIANAGSFVSSLTEEEIEALLAMAQGTMDRRQVVFTHLHPTAPTHAQARVTDESGLLQRVTDRVAAELGVLTPPAEHNRLGHKRYNVSNFARLHIDSFEGMRGGRRQSRRRISRHFVNIGATPRNVCFALMKPELVDAHVGPTGPTYLDALLEAMGHRVELLVDPIPPRRGDLFFARRYLATHLLHCEYGKAPDLVLIVNSDSEERDETLRRPEREAALA